MDELTKTLSLYGIVPVAAITEEKQAVPLAKALSEGGLPLIEVTLRTKAAVPAIAAIAEALPDVIVGAGTVLNRAQAEEAVGAGAKFIVSPGIDAETVGYCQQTGVTVLPGVSTATEAQTAVSLGLDAVKFFPAEASGGVAAIRALSAPFGGLRFLPTGGVNTDNMLTYLREKAVFAVGGSFMLDAAEIAAARWDIVAADVRRVVLAMMGYELRHVGVNCENADGARSGAAEMEKLFGFAPAENAGAVFAGGAFEFMKAPYLGKLGHVAIGTNFLERAMFRAEAAGYGFNRRELKYNPDGSLRAAYFDRDFSGFAIHLLQK